MGIGSLVEPIEQWVNGNKHVYRTVYRTVYKHVYKHTSISLVHATKIKDHVGNLHWYGLPLILCSITMSRSNRTEPRSTPETSARCTSNPAKTIKNRHFGGPL